MILKDSKKTYNPLGIDQKKFVVRVVNSNDLLKKCTSEYDI